MRSARGRLSLFAAGALVLTGCTTTQHEAQRERLDSARQRAALGTTRVFGANTVVRPTSVAQVRAGGRTALLVTIRNHGRRAVTDLPISVGYTTSHGISVFLNSAADLDYFQTHLPAIGAGGSMTWIYTTRRAIPGGARPFARVGLRRSAPALLTDTNVTIPLRYRYLPASHALTVHLSNPTSVPQYQLQVYAYARRGGRYVGAASATVTNLGAGSSRSVRLGLVGSLGNQMHVQAIPTILQ